MPKNRKMIEENVLGAGPPPTRSTIPTPAPPATVKPLPAPPEPPKIEPIPVATEDPEIVPLDDEVTPVEKPLKKKAKAGKK